MADDISSVELGFEQLIVGRAFGKAEYNSFVSKVRERIWELLKHEEVILARSKASAEGAPEHDLPKLPILSKVSNLVNDAAHAVLRCREKFDWLFSEHEKEVAGMQKVTKTPRLVNNERHFRLPSKELPEELNLDRLLEVMFTRKMKSKNGKELPFCLLTQKEMALVKKRLQELKDSGRLISLNKENMSREYHVMREEHITSGAKLFKTSTTPARFRRAAEKAADYLVSYFLARMEDRGYQPDDIAWVAPWRSALVLAKAAKDHSVDTIAHLGVKRNHDNLQPEVYYENIPDNIASKKVLVVADPMLATGGTSIEAAEKLLQKYQGTDVKIVFLSMFAAPEGTLRLLTKYPNAIVFTGSMEDYLNAMGYIVPGLGDFGDKFAQNLTAKQLCKRWKNCLNDNDEAALHKRTREVFQERRLQRRRQKAALRKVA